MDHCVRCYDVATRWWDLKEVELWKVPLNVNEEV
jgi:hypothetical protein